MRHVAAGSHLTVAVTTGGRVFQMGATGASGPLKHCPWEGATLPELVRGQLQGGLVLWLMGFLFSVLMGALLATWGKRQLG